MIAALFVHKGGVYYGLPDVDPWDVARDARRYAGPWPVVAHPPCQRWGRYWYGGPSYRPSPTPDLFLGEAPPRKVKGDDAGCFASALASVERWGGVLEHPAGSAAWEAFGIEKPPAAGGWVRARRGWTCHVEQGHYGHRAPKPTWLYAVGPWLWAPAHLAWGKSNASERVGRHRWRDGGPPEIPKALRSVTPLPFRDLLLSIARSVPVREAA